MSQKAIPPADLSPQSLEIWAWVCPECRKLTYNWRKCRRCGSVAEYVRFTPLRDALEDVGQLTRALHDAREALTEIDRFNHVRNDLDAYLAEVAEWGKGERETRPDPAQFGIE